METQKRNWPLFFYIMNVNGDFTVKLQKQVIFRE